MPYTSNPYAPRARLEAVNLVRQRGWSKAQAARYVGVHRSTLGRWLSRAPVHPQKVIPTQTSRPHQPAGCLDQAIVQRIVEVRGQHQRCAPILAAQLRREGIRVSLSSIERTLRRQGLVRPKRYSAVRPGLRRPVAENPGDLIQIDTIHYVRPSQKRPGKVERYYIYTLIDVASRWAYAELSIHIGATLSAEFVLRAKAQAPFAFRMIQSDNGSEFSRGFQDIVGHHGLAWRHTRVRQSNDNAHIERFNRTIQEECFDRQNPIPRRAPLQIKEYLMYYNMDRLHLGIDCQTPGEIVAKLLK